MGLKALASVTNPASGTRTAADGDADVAPARQRSRDNSMAARSVTLSTDKTSMWGDNTLDGDN